MGEFVYNGTAYMDVADDILGYLEAVIGAKLRLKQPFYLSWRLSPGTSESRTTVWLTPPVPLQYRYSTRGPRTLNPDKLRELMNQAHTAAGLLLVVDSSGHAVFE